MEQFDSFRALLMADRSVRRFDQSRSIDAATLRRLVELTRYCASGCNLQPLRYRMVADSRESEIVFPLLAWAGYLKDWAGPADGERPAAYLVQCLDTRLADTCMCDDGLHLQAITLGARALGIGACIIKAFNAPALVAALGLPDRYVPLHVVALGYPVEQVAVETTDGSADADIRYYRTPDGVHHVPKRPVGELIVE